MAPGSGGTDDGSREGSRAEPPPARRRDRAPGLTRLLRRARRSLLGALLLLGLSIAALHTPAGRSVARIALESLARDVFDLDARLGGVEYSLWARELRLTAVTLAFEAATVSVPSVEARWRWRDGITVRALLPSVVVRQTDRPPPRTASATGLAAQPWRILERLRGAEVTGARVEVRDSAGEPWLVLQNIDVTAETGPDGPSVRLRVADASVGWPGAGLRVKRVSVESQLGLAAGRLVLRSSRLTAAGSTVEVSGALTRLSPLEADLRASGSVEGGLIGSLAPGTRLGGRIAANAAVNVAKDSVTGTIEVSTPALTVQGFGPWDARGRGRIQGAQLVIDSFQARGFGGRIDAEGPLALQGGARTEPRVRVAGLDPAAIAGAVSGVELPLRARLDGTFLWSTTGWSVEEGRGQGRVAIRPVAGPGLPLAGEAELRVAGRTLSIATVRVQARGATITLDAKVGPDEVVGGRFTADLPLGAVPALLADLGLQGTAPAVGGRVLFQGRVDGPISGLELGARLASEGVALGGHPLQIEGEAAFRAGRISIAPLTLVTGASRAELSGHIPVTGASGDWDLAGDLSSTDVEPWLELIGLRGRGHLAGTVRVSGRRNEPVGRVTLRARGALRQPPGAPAEPAGPPVAGSIDEPVTLGLVAEAGGSRIEVTRLEADVAGGRLQGSGLYDRASRAIQARANADGIAWERLPLLPPPLRRLTGTLSAEVALSGTTTAPQGEARVALVGPALGRSPLPPLALEARSDGRRLTVSGTAPSTFLRGSARLDDASWPLRLDIDLSALPLPAVIHGLSQAAAKSSTLAARGNLTIDVSLLSPSQFRFSSPDLAATGSVRQLGWRIEPFGLQGDAEALQIRGFRLDAADAWLSASGRVGLRPSSLLDLSLQSHLGLEVLDPLLPERHLEGTADLEVQVTGTLDSPNVDGGLRLDRVRGQWEGARWSDLELSARFAGREVGVERFRARLLGGSVSASGSIPLVRLGAQGTPRLAFELRDVDLARLLRPERGEGAESFSLLASLDGEVRGRSLSLDGLTAQGRLTRLESSSAAGGLTLEAPAAWRLDGDHFDIASLRLSGPSSTLEARAEGRLRGPEAGWSATVVGSTDLRLLGAVLPDTTASGPARVDARVRYSDAGWRLDGGVQIEGARLSLDKLNFAMNQIQGGLHFEGDRVRVEATAAAGDGRLRTVGDMRLGPAFLGPAELKIEADRVPIAYPAGFRGRATGALQLTGEPGRYRLEGAVGLRQAYYTAEVDAKQQSLDRLDWQLAALEGGSVADKLALDVRVQLEEPLRVRNSRTRVDLEGALVASGTLAQPLANGQISLREGGELTLSRARVRVTQGRVELNGYPAGTPQVDLAGTTRVSGVAMDLRARGSLDDLRLELSSERSDLSQTDLLALLLTGRTASDAASSSGAVVAEELASALGGVLQKGAGDSLLIDVSPDRSLLNEDTDPTQRFNIGHRVTPNLAVVYSAALDGTAKRWIFDFNPGGGRFRFRAIAEEDNSYSFELTDRFSFDLWSRRPRPAARSRETERLGALRFEGSLPLPENELRKTAGLRVHARHSMLQRDQAAERVRAHLVERGWRGASVAAETRPAARKGGPKGVDLVLTIDPGPFVSIKWSGDDPGTKLREAAEGAWPSFATPESAVAAVARAARWRLQAQGYYAATVEHRVVEAVDRIEATLLVSRGARGTEVDLDLDGNSALADAKLRPGLPKPGSVEFFEALDPRSERISNSLRLAYAGIGHLEARVGTPRSELDSETGRLRVTIPVDEGTPFRVAAVELPTEVSASGPDGPVLKLKAGELFDLAAYLADRDALGAWYRGRGWMDARSRAVLEMRSHEVVVRFLVDAGSLARVAEIRVSQTGKTRDSVIRRSLTVRTGDLLTPASLSESRERLSDVGVFRSVDVRAEPTRGDEASRDIAVNLVHKPDVLIEYGVRYTTAGSGGEAGGAPSAPGEDRLVLASAVELSNPFGWGWRTRAYSYLASDRHDWGVNLDAATLFGLRLRTQLFLFDDTDDEAQLTSRVRGVTAQQTRVLLRDRRGRRWRDRLRLQWGYTIKNVEYWESVDRTSLLRANRGFASLAAIGDERDSLTDPKRGLFWTAAAELARTSLGSEVDYLRLYGQLFTFLNFGPVVWAQGFRLGTVPGTDPLLLVDNRFHAGGPTTVRGFEQNSLELQSEAGDALGGQAVAVFNQELRFPIWKTLHGGVFWDAGYAWPTSTEFDLGELRHSAGIGLRFMFPFGPVRLEYAWVLKPKPGESKGRFVFGLGHAF